VVHARLLRVKQMRSNFTTRVGSVSCPPVAFGVVYLSTKEGVFRPDGALGRASSVPITLPLLAQICRCLSGRACLLCPVISDVDLFSYGEGVIYLNAEVSDGAFDFGVAEQELHGS